MIKNLNKNHSLHQLICDATDNLLESENDDLNKQICTEITRTSDGPKVAAKIINKILNKSLSNHCHQSIWYCLLLLDLAVKTTDSRFCSAVLTKDFLGDLIKIMNQKYQVPEFVQEKFLYILKEWYGSLTNVPGYTNLVKFYKAQMSPPSNNVPFNTQPYPKERYPVSYYQPPLQINKQESFEKEKIIRDIDIIETNLSIFSDSLRSVNPSVMTSEESQFLKDLYDCNKRMQDRITEVLPQTMWEDVINQLLQVNDTINSISERYDRLMSKNIDMRSPTNQDVTKESIDELCDSTSDMTINNNITSDIYDMPSLPSYNEASSYLNRNNDTAPEKDLNLIDFDDNCKPSFYRTLPLPPIPMNLNNDLLTESITDATTNQTPLPATEFDEFIETIARRNQKAEIMVPEEEYAPPLYDEAFSNDSQRH